MKKNDVNNPWTTVGSEIKYENRYIKIVENKVKNPSGNDAIYGVVHFKTYAVAIIPLDEQNNTWIVGQYRYPQNSYEWEVVEGGCPEGTLPLDTAYRELIEEVGLKAESLELILEMQLSNSTTDEVSYTYLARGLTFVGEQPDEDERLEVKKIPFEELYQMVLRNEIRDGLSVASILRAKIVLDNEANTK